jgi:hypothetical protein
MEVLLSNPDARSQQIQAILTQTDQSGSKSRPEMRKQLRAEISIVAEYLREEDTSPSIVQSATSTEVMDPADWGEVVGRIRKYSSEVEQLALPIPRGPLYHRTRFLTAGLSPACSHAYFLNEKVILVFSLSNQGGNFGEHPIFRQAARNGKYYAAQLSERFVAVMIEEDKETTVQVFQYDGQMVGIIRFGMESNGHQWNPNTLLAIHETDNRTWIAVGGSIRQDGDLSGSIKMYRLDENNGIATLTAHLISFNRPKPNPLALSLLKTLAFSPDGRRLVCATNNNRILVWRLSNNARPQGAPFIFRKDLTTVGLPGMISCRSSC